jgi:hypothetical protein
MCFLRKCKITFSNSLPVVGRRIIGRKFRDNLRSLPIFGRVIIFASFQDFGKWASRWQWLNTCVKWTKGRLGRCLRHSFGMPSIPQAFLSFKEFINFFKSHVLSFGWDCRLRRRAEHLLTPLPAVHGFRHTNHVVWTEFLSIQQLRWLSLTDKI